MLGKLALIIDDSATARTMLKHKLNKFDVVCESAVDGFEALQLLQNHQPDIIFLDHIMPGMDGFQVLEQLKANPLTRSIPVVMYTSQAAPKYSDEARQRGAVGVMPKQISQELLSQMLDRAEQYHQGVLHTGLDGIDEQPSIEQEGGIRAVPAIDSDDEAVAVETPGQEIDPKLQPQEEYPAGGRRLADRQRHSQQQRHSLFTLVLISIVVFTQLYWFYRDRQQQQLIDSFSQQLQQQQQAYQEAVAELMDLRAANMAAMDQFQFVMDALVSQVLEKQEPNAVAETTESAAIGAQQQTAEAVDAAL